MRFTSFPVRIDIFSKNITTDTLILEFRSEERKSTLSFFDIELTQKIHAMIDAALASEKTTTLFFYPDHPTLKKIQCFFPEKSRDMIDVRSEYLREIKGNITYYPHYDEEEAFEIFTLVRYQFDAYKTEKTSDISIFSVSNEDFMEKILQKKSFLENVVIARDLVNMPPEDLNPESYGALIRAQKWKNFDVHIFDESDLKKIGCNLIVAVGAGSARSSAMVILTPKNPPKTEKYGLIGKGITFDAGGIQIKPDKGMEDMKCDMAGSAVVYATARYLDSLDTLPVDVTFAMGLAENMTGGLAYKPMDIYTAYNQKTVEVSHTDAEGRLVLADVMSYVEKNYHIDHLITIATLTGACIYALGYNYTGIMGDDAFVIDSLKKSNIPYEKVWQLPLDDILKKSLESEYADVRTLSEEKAGSSIGGAFLSYFQGNARLTHLDIAGPAFRTKPIGYMPKGGTGWGVRLLSEFFRSFSKS